MKCGDTVAAVEKDSDNMTIRESIPESCHVLPEFGSDCTAALDFDGDDGPVESLYHQINFTAIAIPEMIDIVRHSRPSALFEQLEGNKLFH
jgi:hypothetical protein